MVSSAPEWSHSGGRVAGEHEVRAHTDTAPLHCCTAGRIASARAGFSGAAPSLERCPAALLPIAEIDRLGDNHRCMALKGGTPGHTGEPMPDSWPMEPDLEAVAARWAIDPARELVKTAD